MSNRVVARPGICTVSRNDFIKNFEDVPKLSLSSAADIRSKLENANSILSNSSEDWSKRITQLKNVRSILIHGQKTIDHSHLLEQILNMRSSLEASVRDLRSQIVRESSITCSFIVSTFGNEVHAIGEDLLPAAMSQVAVSTKIIASSATTLTEFIIEFIQTRQVFTILSSFSTSKDKSQRRQMAVLLEILIEKWADKMKKPLLRQICELVKMTICDADAETRAAGRRAFAKLDETYPEDAEKLFLELEPSKQKMLRGNDAASSAASLNSERGSALPIRSKLSIGSRNAPHSHISKFLSQRSASAIDPKAVKSHASRLIRPTSTKTMIRTDTSPAAKSSHGSDYSSRPGSRNRNTSLSDTHEVSPRSFLGHNDAFFVSFGGSQQIEMSLNDNDDEFLLPIRRVKKSPQKVAHEMRDDVSMVLKACYSASSAEKREGIKRLLPLVVDINLNPVDVKNIGNCLNRLLSDVSNSMILEVYALFVKTHHQKLGEWLRLALVKLFAKKGSETLPNTRKQIAHALNSILESFESERQLSTVCELMCDPIHLMVPKARVALLEYIEDLLRDYTDRGAGINTPHVRRAIRKMFAWASDPRQSLLLSPYIEQVMCAMFATNSADFSALVAEFDNEQRRWTHQMLERNGMKNGISYQTPKRVEREESFGVLKTPNKLLNDPISLGPFNSTIDQLKEQSTSLLLEKVNLDSTVNLSGDTFDKLQNMHELLSQMEAKKSIEEQNEAMASIYVMMCDGSFSMWEQCYAKLLLNLFDMLSMSKSESNKKLALRILTKMCTIQASKLFDSTEMAVCKVLDAAVLSHDPTTSLAVEDCLRTLATHLPLSKILNIARVILNQNPIDDDRAALVLKMVTRVFEELQSEEMEHRVDDIVPSVIKAYSSTSSTVRKSVVYCLVAMVNRLGENRMKPYFVKLPKSMTNLIQVYINRSISTSLPRM